MTGAWLPDERITPDEATELFRFAGCDLLQRAMDLYEAYRRERGVDSDPVWDAGCVAAYLYGAGRIQGMREERAKLK